MSLPPSATIAMPRKALPVSQQCYKLTETKGKRWITTEGLLRFKTGSGPSTATMGIDLHKKWGRGVA